MLKQKHISICLLWAILVTPFSANAMTLMPSLQAQMEYQNAINAQYQKDKIQMQNEARLDEIRRKNEIRLTNARLEIRETENTLTSAPAENILDPLEKEKALSRVVVRKNNISQPSTTLPIPTQNFQLENQKNSHNSFVTTNSPRQNGNIDMRKVEQTWINWVNSLRSENNLSSLRIHEKLNFTAQDWSDFSKNRGYITHARSGDGCFGETNYYCYNFSAIDKWFQERWVNPTIINRSKHTENIGIGRFSCNSSDCTDQAINAIRKTYNYFLSEKSYNGVHYRTMVNPYFTNMWLGLSHANGTYYLTIHYTTDF